MSVFLIVIAATLTALSTIMKSSTASEQWGHTVGDTQTGMYSMTRELRQAQNVTLVTGYVVSGDVVVGGAIQHVLYQCDLASTCTRASSAVATPARGASGVSIINYVQNYALGVPVFTTPTSRYVQVTVKVRSAGSLTTAHTHVYSLTDGFFTRNT